MKLVNLIILSQLDASPKVGDKKEPLTFYAKTVSTAPDSPFEMWMTDEEGYIKGNVGNITNLKDVGNISADYKTVVYNPDTKGFGFIPAFNIIEATTKNSNDIYNLLQMSSSKSGRIDPIGMMAKVSIITDRGLREYAKNESFNFRYDKTDIVRIKRADHDTDFMLMPWSNELKISYLVKPTDFFEIDSAKSFTARTIPIPLQKFNLDPISFAIKINGVDFTYNSFNIDASNVLENLVYISSEMIPSDGKIPLPKVGNYRFIDIKLSSSSGIERGISWSPVHGISVEGLKITSLKLNGVEIVSDESSARRDVISITDPALKPGINNIEITAIP